MNKTLTLIIALAGSVLADDNDAQIARSMAFNALNNADQTITITLQQSAVYDAQIAAMVAEHNKVIARYTAITDANIKAFGQMADEARRKEEEHTRRINLEMMLNKK